MGNFVNGITGGKDRALRLSLSSHWEALTVHPSSTVESVIMAWGPMQQFFPIP